MFHVICRTQVYMLLVILLPVTVCGYLLYSRKFGKEFNLVVWQIMNALPNSIPPIFYHDVIAIYGGWGFVKITWQVQENSAVRVLLKRADPAMVSSLLEKKLKAANTSSKHVLEPDVESNNSTQTEIFNLPINHILQVSCDWILHCDW